MKGRLLVVLDGNSNRIELSPYTEVDEYLITIYVKNMTSYDEIINSEAFFNDMLTNYSWTFEPDEDNDVLTNYLRNNADKIKEFYQKSNEISFLGDAQQIREYVKENGLTDRTIVYNRVLPLKRDVLNEVKSIFFDIPNIEVIVEGNDASISLEAYENTLNKIEEIAHNVRKLGLSPMEEIMYVYDLVRDREYADEDTTEEYTTSRDLTSVLFGDKIVCVGFATLFNSILNCLGYSTINFILKALDNQDGHMRSLVYVNDEKYEIEGMYFFDPTYDCKQDDNSFLERYLFFAKNYKQIIGLDRGCFDSDYYRFMDEKFINEIEEMFPDEQIHFAELLMKIKFASLNKLLKFSNCEELDLTAINAKISREELIEKIYEVSFLANKKITYDKFLGILYNVRRQQYYTNPEKYAFDMDAITNILIKSKLAKKAANDEENLLMAILGVNPVVGSREASMKVREYFYVNDLERDMARVKLARALKSTLEKKEKEEKKLSFKK